MRKSLMGILCVFLAVIIAFSLVGCKGGGNELTYSGDTLSQSDQYSSTTTSPNAEPLSQSTEGSTSGAETVLYQLTTQQGETVQVISTTAPVTEFSTIDYEPVTVPPMSTTYISQSTTAYQAPTYSSDNTGTAVTTKATTTKEETTEKPIKYVGGVSGDGGIEGEYIKVYADNIFGKEIEAKKGTVTVSYDSVEYKANASVLSKLYANEQVEIDVGIPTSLKEALETSDSPYISVTIPKGLIVGSDRVSNQQFKITIYADF